VDFPREHDVYDVAARLWDVHMLRSDCEWQPGSGYEDRADVVEAFGLGEMIGEMSKEWLDGAVRS